MTPQQKQKEIQGYNPKPILPICSNCIHFRSDFEVVQNYGAEWTQEKNIRCGIGDFAIKKTATCREYQPKP